MSVSKLKRVRTRPEKPVPVRDPDAEIYILPMTVSRPELLVGKSDRRFRRLLGDLLSFASRMEVVREHFGKRLGISGPQYTMLATIAHFQDKHGISVGTLAQLLHLSSAFVTSEIGKLVRRNLLLKRVNPLDRRGVLLSVAPAARPKLDRMATEIRAVNDLFFSPLDNAAFFGALQCSVGTRRELRKDGAVYRLDERRAAILLAPRRLKRTAAAYAKMAERRFRTRR